ncbi:SMP-30/gluconolactonase/LRE family protein [Marinomonas sp. 15G1-11]|uniref:SMP-30/gluconolactonase/LRE family protein n=1 Tax=Marinomonas phaeophyticola TaxID=3004091 RepID=A0ABT4JRP1_9GAMM|nr:SMP-30/gluconolactonase/LRE family protein [Marinomonas sp. 15G1-11]MCZ2721043.1 SMP-30/gluconolactonase/LRE family protein [Marinomonas sp. 15G1-11]
MLSIEKFDSRIERILLSDSILEKVCTGATWSEGPVWLEPQQTLLWSDIPNNRILSWSSDKGMTVWRSPSNFTNGHYLDLDGHLLHCSHGGRSIIKTDLLSGKVSTLVDQYLGKRLNSPNDLVVKSDGSIWFSDPPYGILSDHEGFKADSEQEGNFVFRYDPQSQEIKVVCSSIEEPNGLAFSPDEALLYVADTSAALREDGSGNHHINVFDVVNGDQLSNERLFAEVSPGLADGFRIDVEGWLYTSSEDSIQVYHYDGSLLAKIFVPEKVSNCTFAADYSSGHNGHTLYITASTSIYRIRLNTKGSMVSR